MNKNSTFNGVTSPLGYLYTSSPLRQLRHLSAYYRRGISAGDWIYNRAILPCCLGARNPPPRFHDCASKSPCIMPRSSSSTITLETTSDNHSHGVLLGAILASVHVRALCLRSQKQPGCAARCVTWTQPSYTKPDKTQPSQTKPNRAACQLPGQFLQWHALELVVRCISER